jgi:hypothetical protein
VVFDTIELPPIGNEYIFLAKYDPNGLIQYVKQYAAGLGLDIHVIADGCLYFGGGASKGNGHEFDDIFLIYVDRGGFTGKFCEATSCSVPSDLAVTKMNSKNARLTWDAVSGATGYIFQYRKAGTTTWKSRTITVPSFDLKNLTPSTTYETEVATTCASGTSEFSAIVSFTTPRS